MSLLHKVLPRRVLLKLATVAPLPALLAACGNEEAARETATSMERNMSDTSTLQITILLYEGFTALDAIGTYEVLTSLPGARVQFVAEYEGPVYTDTRELSLPAQFPISAVNHTDVLLIPGGSSAGTVAALKNERILSWIRAMHLSSRWTTSVCTGALILGAAGLLNGLQATTYYSARNSLKLFGATYVPERYVQQGKIITAAGVSAGIDMTLFLAEQIAGKDVAQAIQLGVEYDPHPPFNTGSFQKASPATIDMAAHLVQARLGKGTRRN